MTFEIWIEQKKKYSYQRMLFVWFQYEMRGWVQTLFHRSITRWKYRLIQQNRAHDRVSEIKSKILLKKKIGNVLSFQASTAIDSTWIFIHLQKMHFIRVSTVKIYHHSHISYIISYVVLDLCFTRFHINQLDSVSNLQWSVTIAVAGAVIKESMFFSSDHWLCVCHLCLIVNQYTQKLDMSYTCTQ